MPISGYLAFRSAPGCATRCVGGVGSGARDGGPSAGPAPTSLPWRCLHPRSLSDRLNVSSGGVVRQTKPGPRLIRLCRSSTASARYTTSRVRPSSSATCVQERLICTHAGFPDACRRSQARTRARADRMLRSSSLARKSRTCAASASANARHSAGSAARAESRSAFGRASTTASVSAMASQ